MAGDQPDAPPDPAHRDDGQRQVDGRAGARRRPGWPLLDNDALVRELTGREPAAIDAEDGEDALHAPSSRLPRRSARPAPAVITAAGSVVDDPWLRAVLRDAGWVVWLGAGPKTLVGRIGGGRADGRTRPTSPG